MAHTPTVTNLNPNGPTTPLSNITTLLQQQEKERLYVELKAVLARQPGPEAAQQAALYAGGLRDKTKQLKAMAAELGAAQAAVADYKYEVERLSRELAELKRRWFEAKRREQRREQRRRDGGLSVLGEEGEEEQEEQAGGGAAAASASAMAIGGSGSSVGGGVGGVAVKGGGFAMVATA